MTVSAIVPVWNGRELLDKLLASLAAQTLAPTEILAVDNGSTDGAPDLARRAGARVIPMGRNAGFAAAVNRGIRESTGEWVAVLNSDVQLAPDYFEKLAATRAWFATGKLLRPDGKTIDGTFDLTIRAGATWRTGAGRPDGPLFSERRQIASAPWTAALFRRELFAKIGCLEERFESYLEDVDFGLRCAALKITGEYIPDAVAVHRGSASLGKWHREIVRRMARNQLLIVARHFRGQARWPIFAGQTLWGLVALRHGHGLAWLRGIAQGLRAFSAARRDFSPPDPAVLGEYLRASERTLRELQRATGWDPYWRIYFHLTGEAL